MSDFTEVGQDGHKCPRTMDGLTWAKEFCKRAAANPNLATDVEAMHGWFANAVMAGFDEAQRRFQKPEYVPTPEEAARMSQ